MGQCNSNGDPKDKGAQQQSKAIDKLMNGDHVKENEVIKILLLGAGESGKSTLFKQMTLLHGEGFTAKYKEDIKKIIHHNMITGMKSLLRASVDLSEEFEGTQIDKDLEDKKQQIEDMKLGDELDEECGKILKELWSDAGIKKTYELRSNYHLSDSVKHYLDDIDRCVNAEYVPSKEDILYARARTTGIYENFFEIEGNTFQMLDVGGQRNERKKWIHCFEDVTSVIFCVAMSAYDQTLLEDATTNRLHEALNLFKQVCTSPWFRDTAMILFLNKKDLFAKKCEKVSLSVCWSDYFSEDFDDEYTEYEKGCEFMQEKFESAVEDKKIYSHVTCATDSGLMKEVFEDVRNIIIQMNLAYAGFDNVLQTGN